jgi:hypothetical protein
MIILIGFNHLYHINTAVAKTLPLGWGGEEGGGGGGGGVGRLDLPDFSNSTFLPDFENSMSLERRKWHF